MDLPPEVRKEVFSYLWQPDPPYAWFHPYSPLRSSTFYPHWGAPIYLASKQMYREFQDFMKSWTPNHLESCWVEAYIPEHITRWDMDYMFQTVKRRSDIEREKSREVDPLFELHACYEILRPKNPFIRKMRFGIPPGRNVTPIELMEIIILVYHYAINVPHLQNLQIIRFVIPKLAILANWLAPSPPPGGKMELCVIEIDLRLPTMPLDRVSIWCTGRGEDTAPLVRMSLRWLDGYVASYPFFDMPNPTR